MNWIALARLAFDAGHIEDPGQLTEDGLALNSFYHAYPNEAALANITESALDSAIPALSRTAIVLGNLWGDKTKRQDIINAVKGL